MQHVTRIQIFKINELRTGVGKQSGRAYAMQDCEVGICTSTGAIEEVGVLMLPKELTDQRDDKGTVTSRAPAPGLYDATFTLGTDQQRRVIARIASLTPAQPRPVASAPSAATAKP